MELLNTFEPDPEITLREVHTRDKGVCGWCHTSVELKDGEVDHIYPLSRGGKHTWENVQLTHFWCNSAKGNR
jgi:5-methylcytosine-specific restriction endonuclease McrA